MYDLFIVFVWTYLSMLIICEVEVYINIIHKEKTIISYTSCIGKKMTYFSSYLIAICMGNSVQSYTINDYSPGFPKKRCEIHRGNVIDVVHLSAQHLDKKPTMLVVVIHSWLTSCGYQYVESLDMIVSPVFLSRASPRPLAHLIIFKRFLPFFSLP